ncbi:MAG: beta-propeller fold lactonase family protein [Phycisphaerae bacterium]|nr:beta-propeller fold lactonase family protein [Phycisphaerae bacterium]
MRWHVCFAAVAIVGAAGSTRADESGVPDRHPIYVGVKTCTKCHSGKAAGHPFSLWRASKHAEAYACLWNPASKKIAELSGIPEEPQKAAMCLGCHATAANAEAWEKEDAFLLEDGVQCEKCHGPGSEYMSREVMMDRQKAMAAGLMMPNEQMCMTCHNVKGSHVAILTSPVFDVKAGMKAIAHPVPKRDCDRGEPNDQGRGLLSAAAAANPGDIASKRKYVGVMACAKCHQGMMMNYQFSKWRLGRHARAYAVLGTPAGYEMAAKAGIQGDPQACAKCLRCHAPGATPTGASSQDRMMDGFDPADGVQCEHCHGPGSEYCPEAIMRDQRAAKQAGLQPVTEKTCMTCHENAHGRKFDCAAAMKMIAHPTRPPDEAKRVLGPRYKTPLNLALSPDGKELYVVCEASNTVIVVDVASRKAVAEIETGGQPTDVTFSPDGSRAYVTHRLDDSLAVMDTRTRRVLQTIHVGDEPHGVLTDESGRRIYVLNTSADSISVIDAETLDETKRLTASRGPWSLAISPDGKRVAATNTLSRFVKFRTPSVSEVTIVDTDRGIVENRVEVAGANLMQGIAWHPSGEYALITLNRTKNLVPMTRLLQGWTITNGMGVIWKPKEPPALAGGRTSVDKIPDSTRSGWRVDQVLLDEPNLCFPDAADVAISPDGKYAFVTSSGSDRVAVVDCGKLIKMLRGATPYEREHIFPNHLGKPTEFVVKHIPTKNSPRGVLFSHDGKAAYVANALDDSITVIDVAKLDAVARIDLGGPKEITKVRYGERLFHSADITFHRQFSCHSCHPDGHIDGLTYDIEPDGVGISPVDNRTLRGILDTAPFKWEGTNPSLSRQCGPRLAVFFTRIQPFTPEELSALDNYICTIPRPPNRYRPVGGELTPAQRRGKIVFNRMMTNDGRIIPVDNRCSTCHSPPYYTDRTRRDIGTKMWLDRESEFDVPHLNNVYDSAPYLHNGIAETLEQIWTDYNPYDQHGISNDMTKDQLNDLVEFLKTL